MKKYFLDFIYFQKDCLQLFFFETVKKELQSLILPVARENQKLLRLEKLFAFYETENSIYYIVKDIEEMQADDEPKEKQIMYYVISQYLYEFYFQYFQIYYKNFSFVNTKEKQLSTQTIHMLLEIAVLTKVSDIHFEIFETNAQIRFRIDGKLKRVIMFSMETHSILISQIKILSKLNIVEKRLPQDGSFSKIIEKYQIDFRVSILPNIYGEKAVIRILDRNNTKFNLESLGFESEQLLTIKRILTSNAGIILNCGPTGSGKTTTLYSFLQYKNKEETNIVTIEDPVEYHLEGITQIACREEIGLNFSVILKSLLRQDPDIIMIGEIRDRETAALAIKAALTGHLVFSTIHAKNSTQCIDRLCDLGISPFLISNSLLMILSQRLFRKNCIYCRNKNEDSVKLSSLLAYNSNKEIKSYSSVGCSHCNYKGYLGRIGVYELFIVDDYNRNWILCRDTKKELKPHMISLDENVLNKIKSGIISLEEVIGEI